jgi:hypothetical protein
VVTSGNLHYAAGPIYFSSQKFDSTSLLNRWETVGDHCSYIPISMTSPQHVLAECCATLTVSGVAAQKYPAPFPRIQRPRQSCPDSEVSACSHRYFVIVDWYAKSHRTDSALILGRETPRYSGTANLARLNCPTARGRLVPILGRDTTCRPEILNITARVRC